MSEDTNLKIKPQDGSGDIVMPAGSSFGVSTSIRLIGAAASMRRTVNGRLVVIADPAFRKYAVSINASDMILPPIFDLYTGQRVTVELATIIRERGQIPTRPYVFDTLQTGNGWIEYRPILVCLVVEPPEMSDEEYAGTASWSIELEEV